MGLEPDRVLDLLVELVDQSLVVVTTGAAPAARYDLLETVRDYARTRLGERPDAIAARAAHRAWFLALADAADSGMISSEHRTWQRRLELEHGNLRAAYDDAIATGHADEAVRLVSRRWWFWSTTFRHAEGRALLEAALAVAGDDLDVALLVEALTVDCYLAGQLLDVDHAVAAGERAVALSLTLGDAWTTAWARQSLALSLEVRGDHERASELLAAAREVMAAAGDDWRVAGNDLVTCVTGLVAGDLDHVETAAREVVVRSARAGFAPFRCWGQLVLAAVAERRGDLASALAEDQRALALARRLELPHYISFALTQLGRVARRSGDLRTAQVALDEAVAVADAAGASWFAALARRGLAQVHRARGDEAGAAALLEQVRAWADGPDSGSGAAVFFLVVGGEPVARSAPIQ
jgi:ATP/maltotriose-dependent transcriptional regulator MalT